MMYSFAIKSLSLFFVILLLFTQANAQGIISQPIMAGNNAPIMEICEKASIQLRFEHFNFLFNNVFTVEMAANGDFNTGPIINLIGERAVAGNSTNQNINVSIPIPNQILPNTNYQVRIKGSSPVTYSLPNQFPFKVAKIGSLADTAFFPEGYWRGSFFKWTPTTPAMIIDANTQDMFNPNNYLGYVTKEALSFDLNWGFDITAAPGNLFDTSKVCGNQANFYSIRMRRKINFEAGYYNFGVGGDDGFRLSTDGGSTWLISSWRDQEFTGRLNNNGCGVFLDAGPKNVVVDYYERAEHSRFQVIIRRTGDPLADPFTITNPAAGSTVCIQTPPFQMTSTAPGAETWSGPGVSPTGIFDPRAAGLGLKTISYQTGMAAFTSNCVKTTSVTIRVVEGLNSDFTGIDTSYCEGVDTINLVPEIAGGIFVGAGVVGTQLFTENLAPGRQRIGYALDQTTGCGGDTVWKTFVIRPKPNATFQTLPDSVFTTSPAIQLVPLQSGGVFSGDAVVPFNSQWLPSLLPPGTYRISYNISANGCSSSSEQIVRVVLYVKPMYVIPNVISPNGDAANEVFFVKGFPDGVSVSIFNRWGKEIYMGKTENELVWKGPEGNETGTYFYKLVNEKDGEIFTGWLTVVK
jgi:gliding motility-associated-like protein